jgi:tripartite-type tricarboxylate transporter receptor subunit TctC
MWGPKGLPRPIVTRWNGIVAKWLSTEEAQARLKAEGLEPGGGPPEEAAKVVGGAIEKWRRVMREARIKPET